MPPVPVDPLIESVVDDIRQHPKLVVTDDFEIVVQRRLARAVTFRDGERMAAARGDRLWVSLRILHRKRPGRAATEFRGREATQQLVESAFDSALRSSVDPWFRFPLWKQPRAGEVPPAPAVDFPLPGSLFAKLTVRPDNVEETYEEWSQSTFLFRKTERFQLRHRQGGCTLRFSILNHAAGGNAGDFFWVREQRQGKGPIATRERHLEDLLLQSVALAEGERFRGLPRGYLLLAPAAAAALLEPMSDWFSAERVQAGASPLAEKREAPIFSPAIEIVDHGRHPLASDASPFDLEGSLTQETTLVSGGTVRDFLYDAYAAARENRLSTGNFLRGPDAPGPKVTSSSFFVRPSSIRASELRKSMSHGLFLQNVSEVEPEEETSGRLRLRGTGWRVESGTCVEPLRDVALTVDAIELFRRGAAVGDDLAFFGRHGAPSILFEDVPLDDLS